MYFSALKKKNKYKIDLSGRIGRTLYWGNGDDDDDQGAAPRPNRPSNEHGLLFSAPPHGQLLPTGGDWRARLTWLAAPANMPSSASSPPTFCQPLAALLRPVSGLLLFTRQTVFTNDVRWGSLLARYHLLPSESDLEMFLNPGRGDCSPFDSKDLLDSQQWQLTAALPASCCLLIYLPVSE